MTYFAASIDDAETNRKLAESLEIDFLKSSDLEKSVARAYGVLSPDEKHAQRWTFYIGTDGGIIQVDKDVHAVHHGKDVAGKLEELGVARR